MTRRDRKPSSLAGPPAPFPPTSVGLGGITAVFIRDASNSSSTQRPLSTARLRQPLMVRSTGAPRFTALHRCCGFYKSKARPSTSKRITTHFIARLALSRDLEPIPQYLLGLPGVRMSGKLVSGDKPCQNSRGEGRMPREGRGSPRNPRWPHCRGHNCVPKYWLEPGTVLEAPGINTSLMVPHLPLRDTAPPTTLSREQPNGHPAP